ncbi:hypothetical protein BX600DRAFT_517283 [Xylariales sp. PMI_506]|nr:hypothetical protein BX600DRAFT_517283 [Xylariales sp. PMI_506]
MSTTKKDGHAPLLSPAAKPNTPTVSFTPSPEDKTDSINANRKSMAAVVTPIITQPRKADTNLSWGTPLGLGVRGANDENLIIFRKAVGINWKHGHSVDASATSLALEEGRGGVKGRSSGIYRTVVEAQRRKRRQHYMLTTFLYALYFAQVVVGAALTALGPSSADHSLAITLLGALNTVVAGVLALIKGSGQPQRLGKDQVGYRKLQDWIEETEALLAVGVIGRDRKEVGLLVEVAFKKYNAAKASEENNRPDMYVSQPLESLGNRASSDSSEVSHKNGGSKSVAA